MTVDEMIEELMKYRGEGMGSRVVYVPYEGGLFGKVVDINDNEDIVYIDWEG